MTCFLLESLPAHVVVVGGGFIACEFACILHGLGVQVDPADPGDHLLRGFSIGASSACKRGWRAEENKHQPCDLPFARRHSKEGPSGVTDADSEGR